MSHLRYLLSHMTQTALTGAIAQVIETERKHRKWSYRVLSDHSKVSLATLARKCTGPSPFSVLELAQVADAFGVSVLDLVVAASELNAEDNQSPPTTAGAA